MRTTKSKAKILKLQQLHLLNYTNATLQLYVCICVLVLDSKIRSHTAIRTPCPTPKQNSLVAPSIKKSLSACCCIYFCWITPTMAHAFDNHFSFKIMFLDIVVVTVMPFVDRRHVMDGLWYLILGMKS